MLENEKFQALEFHINFFFLLKPKHCNHIWENVLINQ